MSTAEHADPNRRDFLYIATGAAGAVGAALVAWPFIDQMNPDASVRALASIELDIAPIAEGQSITIKWRGNPVFVRHRTQKEIDDAKAVPISVNQGVPLLQNRRRDPATKQLATLVDRIAGRSAPRHRRNSVGLGPRRAASNEPR